MPDRPAHLPADAVRVTPIAKHDGEPITGVVEWVRAGDVLAALDDEQREALAVRIAPWVGADGGDDWEAACLVNARAVVGAMCGDGPRPTTTHLSHSGREAES